MTARRDDRYGRDVDGRPHIDAVMAVEGDRAISGHLYKAKIGTWFARAYLLADAWRHVAG